MKKIIAIIIGLLMLVVIGLTVLTYKETGSLNLHRYMYGKMYDATGIGRYFYSEWWNIGLARLTPDELVKDGDISSFRWLEHPYRDRFFADPFILDVNGDTVDVLVEEKRFDSNGDITHLTIDASTMKLLSRKVILDLDTHLSYPYIYRADSLIYVIPENCQSGVLKAYEYDLFADTLVNPKIISYDGLIDATMLCLDGDYARLFATIPTEGDQACYLSIASSPLEKYEIIKEKNPVQMGIEHSRPGGGFFYANGNLYRPTQDCKERYGESLRIMEVDNLDPYQEHEVMHLTTPSQRFDRGIHTLNFHSKGYAVADAYGYLYPNLGPIIRPSMLWLLQGVHNMSK